MMQVTFLQQVQGMEKTEEDIMKGAGGVSGSNKVHWQVVAAKWTASGYPIVALDLSDAVLLWRVKSHAIFSYIKINPQPHREENSGKCSSDLAELTKELATIEGVEFAVDFENRANSSYWWIVFVRWVRGLFAHFLLERFSLTQNFDSFFGVKQALYSLQDSFLKLISVVYFYWRVVDIRHYKNYSCTV